jgi:DNA replication and repair protein RecF
MDVENRAALRRLTLREFRLYSAADLELSPGFTILEGPNAAGKTSLLEAVYLLGTGRLLRARRDAEAVRSGAELAEVHGKLEPSGTQVRVELPRGGRKRVWVNEMSLRRAADLLGRLPMVCAHSEDMDLLRGEPAERRLYMDLELSAAYPAYLRHLADYRRALEQRNALLKQARETWVEDAQFEIWEVTLAEHGEPLRRYRREFVAALSGPAADVQAHLGGEELGLRYETADAGMDVELLARNRAAEVARGSTQIGPHRDDLAVAVAGRDARIFASQGQQRTAVLALKLALLPVLRGIHGRNPLLLLDDMLSDLDQDRRARLSDWVVHQASQALLTCTEARAAGEEILRMAEVVRVESGRIMTA